jgi:hypothetical protein
MSPDIFTNISYKEKYVTASSSIFHNIDEDFCSMHWLENEYLLASNRKKENIAVHLPEGVYSIISYDFIKMENTVLEREATGRVVISSPDSRAGLIHIVKLL